MVMLVAPRLRGVAIEHMLHHQGGWNRSLARDLTFQDLQIATEMVVPSPSRAENTARYLLSQPLQFTPGSSTSYSNVGYQFHGLIVEVVSGMDFEQYVKTNVFQSAGIPDWKVEIGRTFAVDQNLREPHYSCSGTGVNVFDPTEPQVPLPYGSWHYE